MGGGEVMGFLTNHLSTIKRPHLQQVDQEEDALFLQEVVFRDVAAHNGTPVADAETETAVTSAKAQLDFFTLP